jgi:hypothetical protein
MGDTLRSARNECTRRVTLTKLKQGELASGPGCSDRSEQKNLTTRQQTSRAHGLALVTQHHKRAVASSRALHASAGMRTCAKRYVMNSLWQKASRWLT